MCLDQGMSDKTLADWIPTAKSTNVFCHQSFVLYSKCCEVDIYLAKPSGTVKLHSLAIVNCAIIHNVP